MMTPLQVLLSDPIHSHTHPFYAWQASHTSLNKHAF